MPMAYLALGPSELIIVVWLLKNLGSKYITLRSGEAHFRAYPRCFPNSLSSQKEVSKLGTTINHKLEHGFGLITQISFLDMTQSH